MLHLITYKGMAKEELRLQERRDHPSMGSGRAVRAILTASQMGLPRLSLKESAHTNEFVGFREVGFRGPGVKKDPHI